MAAVKQQIAKMTKKMAVPLEIRRNTLDGLTCYPGTVTAENVVEKLQLHRKVECFIGFRSLNVL